MIKTLICYTFLQQRNIFLKVLGCLRDEHFKYVKYYYICLHFSGTVNRHGIIYL